MFGTRRLQRVLGLILLVGLLLDPLPPARPPATASAAGNPSPLAAVPPAATGLYRATVALADSAARDRLKTLGVVVLSETPTSALVLADAAGLEDLARLRFEPQAADDLAPLVAAGLSQSPWLAASLQPPLAQAAAVDAQRRLGAQNIADLAAPVRRALQSLSAEQKAGLAALSAVDDDGDGLTNTEESWWCTDPGNQNTRGLPGFNDGDRVRRLKDWIASRRSGPPLDSGKPFNGWPSKGTTGATSCRDDDGDDVPDLAEQNVLGLNPNQYSTARDRFSDGLKLYGSDSTRSALPAYLRPPGSHPLVAAYPVVDIQVVQNSLTVQPVTTITTEKGTMQQTSKTYQTSVMEGTSTSVADTVTWNDWQEVSTTTALGSQSVTASPLAVHPGNGSGAVKATIAPLAIALAVKGICIGYNEFAEPLGIGELLGNDRLNTCGGIVKAGAESIVNFMGSVKSPPTSVPIEFPPGTSIDLNNVDFDTPTMAEALKGCRIDSSGNLTCDTARTPANQDIARDQAPASPSQDRTSGLGGTQLSSDGRSSVTVQRQYQVSVPAPRFVPTRTTTSGRSWGGAQTTTHTQYQEVTNTEGTSYTDGEDWRTAVAQDAAHAAELWFTYRLSNRGTDYAGKVCEATFNIYIGNDRIPTVPYRPAADLDNEDGCFHDLGPGVTVDYPTSHIVLTLDQLRAIDTGQPVRINLESFTLRDQTLDFANARSAGVLLGVEDGNDDGNEQIDQYLIARWRDGDSVQDILARYFPFDTDGAGSIIAIWTPKYRGDTPAWCVEPRRPYDNPDVVVWCKHAISTAEWWTIYLNNLGDGTSALRNTPARPGSQLLFRFNKDSDGDGYSDRTERNLGTAPFNPASFPKPELIAGVYAYPHAGGAGTLVTATLSLLNTGRYDAYGVEAVMVAPDDSVSIVDNTVGGSGRVRALSPVIVGSKVLTPTISPSTWHGTASPASGGYYTGTVDTRACYEPWIGSGRIMVWKQHANPTRAT